MRQIARNWMFIVVFPLLAGLLFRWLMRRWRRGRPWLRFVFIRASTPPIPGSEGPGFRAIQAACLTLGAGVMVLMLKLKRRL